MRQTLDQVNRPRIDASRYASRGLVSCTRQGKIVWWGPLPNIVQAPTFEIVHCNDEDVSEVLRMFSNDKRQTCR